MSRPSLLMLDTSQVPRYVGKSTSPRPGDPAPTAKRVVWKRQKTRCHCCTSYHSLLLRGTSLQAENRHDHKWPRSGSGPTLESRASKPLPDGEEEHEIFQTSRRSLRQAVGYETDEKGRSKRCCFLASPKTGDMRSILYDGHNFIPCHSLCPPGGDEPPARLSRFDLASQGNTMGASVAHAHREAVSRAGILMLGRLEKFPADTLFHLGQGPRHIHAG